MRMQVILVTRCRTDSKLAALGSGEKKWTQNTPSWRSGGARFGEFRRKPHGGLGGERGGRFSTMAGSRWYFSLFVVVSTGVVPAATILTRSLEVAVRVWGRVGACNEVFVQVFFETGELEEGGAVSWDGLLITIPLEWADVQISISMRNCYLRCCGLLLHRLEPRHCEHPSCSPSSCL
jgi:hypothetical protein